MFCTNTLTDSLHVKDKHYVRSSYLHIQKLMTFVRKRKHWSVLEFPLASKIRIYGGEENNLIVLFMCDALCTDTQSTCCKIHKALPRFEAR